MRSSPFQPLPLQETVEVDAVEVVSKRGYTQVLVGQPIEKAQPTSQPGSQLDGLGPLLHACSAQKAASSANPPANPPSTETHTDAEAEDVREGRQHAQGHTAGAKLGCEAEQLSCSQSSRPTEAPSSGHILGLWEGEAYRVSSWKRSLQGPFSSRWAQLVTSCWGISGMRSGPWGQATDRSVKGAPLASCPLLGQRWQITQSCARDGCRPVVS